MVCNGMHEFRGMKVSWIVNLKVQRAKNDTTWEKKLQLVKSLQQRWEDLYRLAMQSDRNRSNFEVETQQLATSTRRNKPKLGTREDVVQTSRNQRTERKWTWNQFWFYHLWSWWLNVSNSLFPLSTLRHITIVRNNYNDGCAII